jgi:hypothetical protein
MRWPVVAPATAESRKAVTSDQRAGEHAQAQHGLLVGERDAVGAHAIEEHEQDFAICHDNLGALLARARLQHGDLCFARQEGEDRAADRGGIDQHPAGDAHIDAEPGDAGLVRSMETTSTPSSTPIEAASFSSPTRSRRIGCACTRRLARAIMLQPRSRQRSVRRKRRVPGACAT